jgi:trehalose synthase
MTIRKLRSRFLALIAALLLCAVGHQLSFAQDSANYINFLEQNSMLFQADQEANTISGMGVQFQHHFDDPETSQFVQTASVWLLYYPGSVITEPGQSVLGLWGADQYWSTLQSVGITAQHTNPVQIAGGISGTKFTPTTDGWFDRISLNIDPQFGTEAEYTQMVKTSANHGGIIGSDLVPLHTGFGADFRLAERAYKDYPGMFVMSQIPQSLWNLLPPVRDPWGQALLPVPAAVQLRNMGYIPGTIHDADADPAAATWSGWSATPEVVGVDGVPRRWVYLHVFKPEQPTLNWLDPSFAGPRSQYGDMAKHIVNRGTKFLRLDAVPFTAIDPDTNDTMAQTYLEPVTIDNTNDLAFMARKLGGWTYQELNVPVEQLKQYTQYGPDLSYDFFTRAEVLHPLITGNVLPLRLEHSVLLQQGVQVGTMVHDLQNHDEITYQLINLAFHQSMTLDGQTYNGAQLKQQMLQQMQSTVGAAPYNKLYRPQKDGIATTFAGFIAAAMSIDPYHATPEQVALIQRAHLLLAHANAMIPGVFAISAWDLVGALPIPPNSVANLINGGGSTDDWRWINRGAVDLINVNPSGVKSTLLGIPKATTLYGPVPQQLTNPNSFVSQIRQMLAARQQYQINQATMNAVPPTGNPAVCVLVMTLPNSAGLAVTALNYGRSGSASVQVDLTQTPPGIPASSLAGKTALDIVDNQSDGTVGSDGKLTINLNSLSGKTLVIQGVAGNSSGPQGPINTPPNVPGS